MEKFITLDELHELKKIPSHSQEKLNEKSCYTQDSDSVSLSYTEYSTGQPVLYKDPGSSRPEQCRDPDHSINLFKFIRKKQVNNNNDTILANENYFLSPSFEIKLYNPKIIEINQKYIVFKYCDNDEERLKNISDSIINSFKNSILLSSDTIINPLCTQYIRCTLPIPWSPYKKSHYRYLFDTYKGNTKYNIHSDNIKTLLNYNLNKIIIDVKNIWKSDNKYGFNCIIKDIYIY